VLDARVVDELPFRVGLQADNHRPPSVGAEEISLLLADLNLTGNVTRSISGTGSPTAAMTGFDFSGSTNVSQLCAPVEPYDTTLGAHAASSTEHHRAAIQDINIAVKPSATHLFCDTPSFNPQITKPAFTIAFDRRQTTLTSWASPSFRRSRERAHGFLGLRLSQEWLAPAKPGARTPLDFQHRPRCP